MEFGEYELLGRIATGGYAHIFLARKTGPERNDGLVCLKTLVPDRAKDEAFVTDFLTEAELAKRLSHPNCVRIHELGRERNTYFICMEFIAGETLAALAATHQPEAPLPVSPVLSVIAAACDGLHYAHELSDSHGRPLNLVHRDVSPQNIMVSYSGETKVVDFGIAKAAMERQDTRTGIIKGKVRYMSPEQITFCDVDRRSDIFSLGLVLFECLTGKQIFDGCSPHEVQHRLTTTRMPRLRLLLPTAAAELEEICARAMAQRPEDRYPTAAEMGDDLRRHLARTGGVFGTEGPAAMVRGRFSERARKRSAILAGVLSGESDDGDVRSTFNARPVMKLDLFGEATLEDVSDPYGDSFDDDATVYDPKNQPEGPTYDDPDPPTTPIVGDERTRLSAARMNVDFGADQTALLPDPQIGAFKDPTLTKKTRPEATRRIDLKQLEPATHGTPSGLVWLFGFFVGLGVGFSLAMLLVRMAP